MNEFFSKFTLRYEKEADSVPEWALALLFNVVTHYGALFAMAYVIAKGVALGLR